MKFNYLRVETSRDRYNEKQVVDSAITVKELIEILKNKDEDLPVILSFDEGYTFGTINSDCINEDYYEEEDED